MTDRGKSDIRQSILGADRAFRVIDGGGGASGPPPGGGAPRGEDEDSCPVTALGDNDGVYHFLDTHGQKRALSARDLGNRHQLLSLFRGDDGWLRSRFKVEKEIEDEAGNKKKVIIDFSVNRAAAFMQRYCSEQGIFGDHVVLRRPGIWRSEESLPIVHCGDQVLIDGEWHPAGTRSAGQIWAAAPPTRRPGPPCDARVGAQLQQDLQNYWSFRNPGGAIAILGLLAIGYYGSATDWRLNGFITGGTGSGKSALRRVVRSAWPLHHYGNDTSKAGLEQAVAGRAMPAIIDEASDRENQSAARALVDLVLSASGDEGTKGDRGTVDGKGRKIEVSGSIIMFTINPPALQPQHLSRFVLVDMISPKGGEDYRAEHKRIAGEIAKRGPELWGRAIASWERFNESLDRFRGELARVGCSPREMDGKGAMLAGWYILTHEGLPDARALKIGVSALGEYVITAEAAEMDDGPQRMIQHLLSSLVQLHRSTDRDPIGRLIDIAFGDDPSRSTDSATEILGHYGMRVIRAKDDKDTRGRPVPRKAAGDGVWFSVNNQNLNGIFRGVSGLDDGKWRYEMLRLDSARKSTGNVRVGPVSSTAFWVSRQDLVKPEEDQSP